MRNLNAKLLTPIALALILGPGCGGGSNSASTGTGRALIKITWPDRSRLIPLASNSIRVVFTRGAQTVDSQLIPRPVSGNQTQTTFTNLKTGSLTLAATAFPNADGTGVAQAAGTTPVTIVSAQTTAVTLTMASTIDHMELSPSSATIKPGQTAQLTGTAKDVAGSVVLTSASKTQWTTSNAAAAAVDANGLVTAVAVGTATITVKDTESGKSASATITVQAVVIGGPVTFADAVTYSVPTASDRVIAKDFDGDGNLDLIVGGTQIVILYGRGDGTFEPYQTVTTWAAGIFAYDAADMNGDGKPDILCRANPDKVFIIPNTGARTFGVPIQIPVGGWSLPKAGDLNGDGKMDMAVLIDTGGPSKTVLILLNNGSGFTNAGSYGVQQFAGGITIADLNGDSKPDISGGFWSSTVGQGGIFTLLGNGDGTFTAGPGFTTGEPGNDTLVADFTGDGKIDLVINNYWEHGIAVLPGQGGVAFGPQSTFTAAPYPLVMGAADFNRDGLLDIAAANAGSSHISLLRSQGGGAFADILQFEAGGDDVRSIALGDFNKDGKMDIATQNQSNSTIGILLNTTP